MVVSKVEFHSALTEINESFSKLFDRVTELEKQVEELTPKTRSTRKVTETTDDE
jgi:hypothetical protein